MVIVSSGIELDFHDVTALLKRHEREIEAQDGNDAHRRVVVRPDDQTFATSVLEVHGDDITRLFV